MVYAICNDFYPTLEKKLNRISKKTDISWNISKNHK